MGVLICMRGLALLLYLDAHAVSEIGFGFVVRVCI
jgi:hypothetical protein